MKLCKRCLVEKTYNEFHKNKQTKDGYAVYCNPCKSALDKEWTYANPERVDKRNKRSKDWRATNPLRSKQLAKEWKEKNPEKYKDSLAKSAAKYREKNREKINKKAKEYYQKNREKHIKTCINWQKNNPENVKISQTKYRQKNVSLS